MLVPFTALVKKSALSLISLHTVSIHNDVCSSIWHMSEKAMLCRFLSHKHNLKMTQT